MFWFTQEPSSGSSPVLYWNYQYGFSVLVGIDTVNVMAAYRLLCRHAVNRTAAQQADMQP